jgi:hypothetical protein
MTCQKYDDENSIQWNHDIHHLDFLLSFDFSLLCFNNWTFSLQFFWQSFIIIPSTFHHSGFVISIFHHWYFMFFVVWVMFVSQLTLKWHCSCNILNKNKGNLLIKYLSCPSELRVWIPPGTLNSFMWRNYPTGLWNIGGFTQVPVCARNNARRVTLEVFLHKQSCKVTI